MSTILIILAAISAILAITMLFAKNPITSALCLLGVLLMTAGIYGMIGEHLVATIQLVVYAGAIMVLFIFSIMLLNLNNSEQDYKAKPVLFIGAIALGALVFVGIATSVLSHFGAGDVVAKGQFHRRRSRLLAGSRRFSLTHSLPNSTFLSK